MMSSFLLPIQTMRNEPFTSMRVAQKNGAREIPVHAKVACLTTAGTAVSCGRPPATSGQQGGI